MAAYEAFASVYNDFNSSNDYEMWLGRAILPELRKHGLLEPGAALDVGCGTGRAFRPLLRRGWDVRGCDLSPAMLEIAAQEGGSEVELQVADMRELPRLGEFDLVMSLNDCMNYLLGDDDLVNALIRMRENLAENGLLVFDVNTSSTYASGYFGVREVGHWESRWTWTGCGEIAPSIFEAKIEGDRLREPIRQVARFWSEREVLEAMRTAGVRPLAALGMSEAGGEVVLSAPPDESRDYKLVFVGARADHPARPGRGG
ncbi:MAG TPA: class I SAM-dependent methyltransferase [Solirubrobacterales bacterium]|nr:class I SAM-dependent methyltransferase [Solirubrobacterales bacterium]